MVCYRIVAAAGLVASVYALPLNINLGAYSPALVVGDGEISFGGGSDVSALFNTLEGAAQNAAAGQTNGAATPATPVVAAASPEVSVAVPATGAVSATTPTVSTPIVAANNGLDPNLQEQAAAISTLQGMGKEIAPREPATEESPKVKRDLAGFDRALKYAEAALTKGPVVQLGTGAKGAGVGIVVDNRPTTGAATAAAAAPAQPASPAAAAKRDESAASQPRLRTRVTTMYVRRGVPLALQKASEIETRDVKSVPVVTIPAAKERRDVEDDKRDTSTTIDAINLNVDDPHGITMTFIETSEDEE